MIVIPKEYLDILQSNALAYAATIGPNGPPHVSPVWFGWNGEHVFFSTIKTRQKYHNLVRDPRISLSITDPANPYRSLEIRGTVRMEDDPPHYFPSLMAQKYLGRSPVAGEVSPDEERVLVTILPDRVLVFAP